MNFNKIITSNIKMYLLFYFLQLIIIKIIFFIIFYLRFKLYDISFVDWDLESIQLLYDTILNPIYLLAINFILTLKQNKNANIINLLIILICIFIGIKLSFFYWKIIYNSNDWEHSMFFSLQIWITIPLYCIIGVIEYVILRIIIKRRQKNGKNLSYVA
jgi:hypothetical protein